LITNTKDKKEMNRRFHFTAFLFIFWAAVIVFRLSYFMIFKAPDNLTRMRDELQRTGRVAALRGRILAKGKNTPLAWSTRHFALKIQVPENPQDYDKLLKRVCDIFNISLSAGLAAYRNQYGDKITIKKDLSPEELILLQKNFSHTAYVTASVYFNRHYRRGFTSRLGSVSMIGGKECGIKGLEKKYNRYLSGRDMVYKVFVNRQGEWVNDTYNLLQNMQPGYDVYLAESEVP